MTHLRASQSTYGLSWDRIYLWWRSLNTWMFWALGTHPTLRMTSFWVSLMMIITVCTISYLTHRRRSPKEDNRPFICYERKYRVLSFSPRTSPSTGTSSKPLTRNLLDIPTVYQTRTYSKWAKEYNSYNDSICLLVYLLRITVFSMRASSFELIW